MTGFLSDLWPLLPLFYCSHVQFAAYRQFNHPKPGSSLNFQSFCYFVCNISKLCFRFTLQLDGSTANNV